MALRPAPLQMHYLGYPGTTGAPFIDYFIGDAITLPEGAESLFSESLIRLPHSYQINDRKPPRCARAERSPGLHTIYPRRALFSAGLISLSR